MGILWCVNVGCADSSIIVANNSDCLIIDCYDGLTLQKYLPVNKKIKALFITHQHYDHFKGMDYLITNNYLIEYLIYSPYERRHGDSSVEYDEWNEFNSYASYY